MGRKACLLVFFVAFILRLGVLLGYKGISQTYEKYDAKGYEAIAVSLMQGKGFVDEIGTPVSVQPPLYPMFLAGVYSLTGHSEFAVRLIQCFIGSGTVVLLMLLAGLLFTPAIAVVSGALAAVYPPFILYSAMKMTECLFMFLFLLECYYLTRAFKERGGKGFAYAGVFHGLSVLVRAPTLLFPVFLLPAVLFTGLRKTMIKGFIVYLAISSAIISVWTVRNYYALNDFLVVSAGRGSLLWYAVQDDTWNGDEIVVNDPLREYPDLKDLPYTKKESIIAERVMKHALSEPGWYLRNMAQNFFRLWTLPAGKVMLARVSPGLASLYQAAHYLLLAITFCGLFHVSRSNFAGTLPSFLYLLYASLMHSVILAATRYRLPYDQLLLMFSAGGLVFLYNYLILPRHRVAGVSRKLQS